MAKYLKVKIRRNKSNAGTHYTYPNEYDAKKIQVLAYESFNEDNFADINGRGGNDEFCLGVVADADAPAFLVSDDIEEMTEVDFKALGDQWVLQSEKVTDQTKVTLILSKLGRKESLGADDLKALDPNDPTPGIGKSKKFSERVDELKVKM